MSIGIHCDRRGMDLHVSIRDAVDTLPEMECVQIFTHGPRNKSRSRYDTEVLRARAQKTRIYTHQTYSTSWKPCGRAHMQDQIDAAAEIGARGIVFHLAHEDPAYHVAVLRELTLRVPVLLEACAHRHHEWLYHEPAQINALCAVITAAGYTADQVGLVTDTAHITVSMVPLQTTAAVAEYFGAMTEPDRFRLLHLNGNAYDSRARAGDKHTTPGGVWMTMYGMSTETHPQKWQQLLPWQVGL